MDTLTSLEYLSVIDFPKLKLSFLKQAFLPPNLQHIEVKSLRIAKPVTEWGLQGLTALSGMNIGGDDIVNLFLKERKLPISLVFLKIQHLSETKFLEGNGLLHLSSLEFLRFYECSELVSLPKKSLPSSLKSLYFLKCPSLESLPEDSLPSSLKQLHIWECPLLEESHNMSHGQSEAKGMKNSNPVSDSVQLKMANEFSTLCDAAEGFCDPLLQHCNLF
ncbi:NBS-LRR disease resistance protein [Trifolium medium]|uniref:NBS-LRR disease resistance protein n=1 Tax=Trifolium medium TaxID=97028 RepID=A0A392NK34_9FABA|nr:NBS-LRR disease resistance protein [Trifolium medium]